MVLAAVKESVPLVTDDHGVVRVAGTRVTLDVIVHAFDAGASTKDELAQQVVYLPL